MISILRRELSINLNFQTRSVKLDFDEPTIANLLRFHDFIKDQKFITAIRIIIPDINEKDFMSNPDGIIKGVSDLIYGDKKKSKVHDNSDEGFLPATLDLMAHRYGILPDELAEKVTFTQLITFMKGYEWNINIQNGNEKNNVRILMDYSSDEDVNNEELLQKLKKDKERLSKIRKKQ